MWPTSDAWKNAVKGAHTRVAYVMQYDPAKRTTVGAPVPIVDWNLQSDYDSAVRRDVTLTLAEDPGWTIYGYDIQILAGVQYSATSEELVPVFTGRITRRKPKKSNGITTYQFDAIDWAWIVQGDPPTVVAIPGATPIETAVRKLVLSRYEIADFDLGTSGYTCGPLIFDTTKDLWDEARRIMFEGAGLDLSFGVTGVCEARSIQSAQQQAYIPTISESDPNFVVNDMEGDDDADEVFNGVIVVGVDSGTGPVRGEAWDDDPDSPTYRKGTFRQRSTTITTEIARTQAQADIAARSALQQMLGAQRRIEFQMIPDVSWIAGDVIDLSIPTLGATGLWMVDSLSFGKYDELMNVGARKHPALGVLV